MDSLKETDNLATKPSKRPRIEVDEELMRQMIAGQAPLDSKVIRRIPEPEAENTDAPEGKTSETVSGASAPTAERTDANTQTSDVKELAAKRFRCRISNARSLPRRTAVTVRRSISVRQPSTKYRQSSTYWE